MLFPVCSIAFIKLPFQFYDLYEISVLELCKCIHFIKKYLKIHFTKYIFYVARRSYRFYGLRDKRSLPSSCPNISGEDKQINRNWQYCVISTILENVTKCNGNTKEKQLAQNKCVRESCVRQILGWVCKV